MSPLALALVIVALILELLAALTPLVPPGERWQTSLIALGLFFFMLAAALPAFGG